MLLGRKAKGVSFTSWLGTQDLPHQIEETQLQQMVAKLRGGDDSVINPIIEGHIRLAMSIVAKYVAKHPRRKNDIIGAALAGLTEGVRKAQTALYDDNITPYLVVLVHRAISDFLEKDHLIPIGRQYIRSRGGYTAFSDALPFERPICHLSLSPMFKDIGDEENGEEEFDLSPATRDTSQDKLIADDLLNQLQLTWVEQQVIDLKCEGYNGEAIAKKMGCSRARICQILTGVRERYLRLEKNDA